MVKVKKSMINDVRFGVEIETAYNAELIGLDIGSYHDGESLGKHWSVEEDGSLDTIGTFDQEKVVEFVSDIFKTKAQMLEGLKEFKNAFKSYTYELSSVLDFNSSCGCHCHISFKNHKFRTKMVYEFYKDVREEFFKLLKESTVLKSYTKRMIKVQYFRSYAKKLSKTNYLTDRSCEFNFNGEHRGLGIEWRSFNLRGLSTWAEFDEIFEILYKVIEFISTNLKTYCYKEKVTIDKSEFIKKIMFDNCNKRALISVEKDKEEVVKISKRKAIGVINRNVKIELNKPKEICNKIVLQRINEPCAT